MLIQKVRLLGCAEAALCFSIMLDNMDQLVDSMLSVTVRAVFTHRHSRHVPMLARPGGAQTQ